MADTTRTALFDARILANDQVAEDVYRMVLFVPPLSKSLQAGMFVNVEAPKGAKQILRIPLSFSHADANKGTVEVVYAVVGDGTRCLSGMGEGETLSLVGPCGNPWRIACEGRACLVAGGIGITPIVACARMLADAGVPFDAVVGVQSAPRLWGEDVLASLGAGVVRVTTDDGSTGERGFATQALESLMEASDFSTIYTCGPEVMMAGVARIARAYDTSCQVSLERMMCCGFAACGTCNVALASGGYASCCKDGPVFDAREVAW